ncbi:MAG: flagellar basal body rod protein FlgB [Lachnospiraceae bacterium]|nr:flagellar basal body rod protein FlgB [Candidatus Colinaster scatohippi]
MISSNAFDYINVLDKAADASAMRNELIANNIANQDTPGYKRQDVDFESQLKAAMKSSKYVSIDDKVSNLRMSSLKPRQFTDYGNYSYRLDGNNVDPEQEQVALAANRLKYQGLMASLTHEFNTLKAVMK